MLNKDKIHSALLISLSNIGDAILTTPVLGVMLQQLPMAEVDILAAPRTVELFDNNSALREVILYDKHAPIKQKISFIKKLRLKRYDLVIDLKNSAFPFLMGARYRTPLFFKNEKNISMKEKHLQKIKALGFDIKGADFLIKIDKESESFVKTILSEVKDRNRIIAISVGARSHIKRWPYSGFINVCKELQNKHKAFLVFLGDKADINLVKRVTAKIGSDYLDLAGKTNLIQLAAVLKRCNFLLCNDSAIMHMACAVKKPVIALFGPTDHKKYGPESENSVIIYKRIKCAPCRKAQCVFNHECLNLITPEEVLSEIEILFKKLNI